MAGRGVHFAAVVVADENLRRRRALRDVVDGLDGIDFVTEASTALEAAKKAQHADVVLMDCTLPDAPIAEAITLVRRAAGGVSVIAVSAGNDPDLVRTALDAGAMSFLSHTGPALTVGDAVTAALRGRGTVDPDLIRPVLCHYAELLEDARRRDRAWRPWSRTSSSTTTSAGTAPATRTGSPTTRSPRRHASSPSATPSRR